MTGTARTYTRTCQSTTWSSWQQYADKSDISTLQSNFQAGVDSIYNAIVAQGTTPASKSLSDVVAGIGTMSANRYNSGYSSGYNQGVADADNRANPNSTNYRTGYNQGVADADARVNTNSASYTAGYNAGYAAGAAAGKTISWSVHKTGDSSGSSYLTLVIANQTLLNRQSMGFYDETFDRSGSINV